jgi:hypothetical protein
MPRRLPFRRCSSARGTGEIFLVAGDALLYDDKTLTYLARTDDGDVPEKMKRSGDDAVNRRRACEPDAEDSATTTLRPPSDGPRTARARDRASGVADRTVGQAQVAGELAGAPSEFVHGDRAEEAPSRERRSVKSEICWKMWRGSSSPLRLFDSFRTWGRNLRSVLFAMTTTRCANEGERGGREKLV